MQPSERLGKLHIAFKEWPDGDALTGLPGGEFTLRRADLRAEWLDASVLRLEAALEAEEREWAFEETGSLLVGWPEEERVFALHLRAGRGVLSAKELRRRAAERARSSVRTRGLARAIEETKKTATTRRSRPAPRPPVRQLPGPGRPLVGRSDTVDAVLKTLAEGRVKGDVVVVKLTGMAGAGKTAAGIQAARQVAAEYPDGSLYTDLRGHTGDGVEPANPEDVLDLFLKELSVRTRALGTDGKTKALRNTMSSRSMLVFLDNAATASQILPLLPGGGTSAVIVTSRQALPGLSARTEVHHVPVGLLSREEAASLLSEGVAPGQRLAAKASIGDLAVLCGFLPMALVVMVERLRGLPVSAIGELVEQLREDKNRLNELELSGQDLSVRLAFDCSFRNLSREARVLLRRMAVHPGPTISRQAMLRWGHGEGNRPLSRVLEELVEAHLVELLESGRYRLHDLVRLYGRHHAPSEAGEAEGLLEHTTRTALTTYQLQYVWACDQVLDKERNLPIRPARGGETVCPKGEADAMELLDAEYEATVATVEAAVRHGSAREGWLIAMALVTYQWRRNRASAAERLLRLVQEATLDIEGAEHRAMYHRMLGGSQYRQRNYAGAERNLRLAVRISEQDDGPAARLSLAHSLQGLATVLHRREDPDGSHRGYAKALALFRSLGDAPGAAAALEGLGTLSCDGAEYGEALRLCEEALSIAEITGSSTVMASILATLGRIHRERYARDHALRAYERAITIYRSIDYCSNEAVMLRRSAAILVSMGRKTEAVEALERAVLLLDRLGDERMSEFRATLETLR
ncbi:MULTISPECIES: tetratricopeptide repeat protein [unclassified Streptomyces]|uniref:tetratricopeptide repeat protein n=1 Tax=unclassified Streptomyces TaxID=2593676 RepID=UPI0016603E74|nr:MULTISPECIES: tetratricopeptide repeat protein [unclassified Streptomyces]MBD0711617.1 hypothetical protein [Streptomyces sp. CBMA291]MBD0714814.1 hypothetical protein [Streptomyces sp. CBMA370]